MPIFSKVLIANRGEIAVRVIRTCQEMGIQTVAVYSEIDHNALHVRLADEAYALPGVSASQSYLNISAIVSAITRSGADAVHPGYGFLSENADFAQTVTDLGVTFIGPPPSAIKVMGDKISARNAAKAVDVHSVPGDDSLIGDSSTDGFEKVKNFGDTHGWPVAVKAAYGGGGRGMKVVHSAEHVQAAIDSAKREAKAYFGRDELYMERYLSTPRHVEVQVLADMHGGCVHIGTRDCSVQRRHQKLIEEAPAVDIPADVLSAMGQAAICVAQGCGYVNAGTVEFLYEDGEFYYLEMNTRLQVEHPVTEMVTGIDLVEQQLLIASGKPLQFTQEDITFSGHAIEVRVNAEDPAGGAFLPCPGTITSLKPAQGFGVRWDGGYEAGDTVSQHYDNLIGKLVVWGRDRTAAIARLKRAVSETTVAGVVTTLGAAQIITSHIDFITMRHSTKWLDDTVTLNLVDVRSVESADGNASVRDTRGQGLVPHSSAPQGSAPHGSVPPDSVTPDSIPHIRREVAVEVNGKRFDVTMWVPDISSMHRRRGNTKKSTTRGSANPGDVTVPMQGTVVKILVDEGDSVDLGEPIMVVEAMKMENNISAQISGTVTALHVGVGDLVGSGDVVATISDA